MERKKKGKGLINFGEKPPKNPRRAPVGKRAVRKEVAAAVGTIPQEINEVDKQQPAVGVQDGGGYGGAWVIDPVKGRVQTGNGLYQFGQTGKGLYNFGGSGLAVPPKGRSYGSSQNVVYPQPFI